MLTKYLNDEEMAIIKEAGYGENGLRYTVEELKATDPSRMTMEQLAQYADAITYAKVMKSDGAFFLPQLKPIPEGQTVSITTTGLGNLAHIATNFSGDEKVKSLALGLFEQIRGALPIP